VKGKSHKIGNVECGICKRKGNEKHKTLFNCPSEQKKEMRMPVIYRFNEPYHVSGRDIIPGLLSISCLLHSQKDIFKLFLIFGFAALILLEFPVLYSRF
jgi:hypothetical protein